MTKALDILNQQLRDETLWLDSHEEAIKELEEAQLTRREWYQKGYAEAMKPKTCDGCKWEQETKLITTKVGDKVDICKLCTRYENLQDNYEKKDNA